MNKPLEDVCPHCFAGVASVEHGRGTGPVFRFRCGHALRIVGAAVVTINHCPSADDKPFFEESADHATVARLSKTANR